MPHPRKVGADNESLAAEHLAKLGYTLVARNFKRGASEIDLIMMDGSTIVFVEVRARKKDGAETPEASLDTAKMDRLWDTASLFIAETETDSLSCRFDVVAIQGDRITHYKDAFRAD